MWHRKTGTAAGKGKKLKFPPTQESPQALTEPEEGYRDTLSLHRASQTGPMESADARPPWLAEVMAAIATCQSTLTAMIEAVQMDVGLLRQDMNTLRTRVAETEQRVSNTEDTVAEHGAALRMIQTKIKALEYRAEDAENRNRRNNLHIVGLAGGSEGANPTCFVEDMLRNLLPDARLPPHYAVERAHRIPPKPGPLGAPPRTFILRLLNCRDRDEILRASRGMGDLRYQNNKLMIFPDYSVETQKLIKSFDHVKAAERVRNIHYSVLFPARFMVQDGEATCFFTSPREASAWLDSLPRDG